MPVQPAGPSPASVFVPPPEDSTPGRRRRRRNWGRYIALFLAVAFVIGLIVAGILVSTLLRQGKPLELMGHVILEGKAGGEGETSAEIDLPPCASFTPPGADWKRDPRTESDFHAALAMKRPSPRAYVALVLKPYGDRNPRAAKLSEEGLRLLERHFKDNVEFERKDEERLGDAHVQHLVFQGEANNEVYSGECYMLAHKGIGFWVFCWTPGTLEDLGKKPSLKEELSGLYRGLLLKDRPGWKGDHPTRHLLTGSKPLYTLEDTEGIWDQKKAEDFDVNADLALQALDKESRLVDKTAEVLLFVLKVPEDGQVRDAARARLGELHKKPPYENATIEPLSTKAGSREWDDHVGDAKGHVWKFRVRDTATRERFVVAAIVPRGDQYILIHCECDWRYRSLWETDFIQLLATFRSQKQN